MLSEVDHTRINGQIDPNGAEVAWQSIKQHLETEKQRIFQEIRQYPPPIPACDVQFNSLLAERAAILQELGKVEAILKQRLTLKDTIGLLEEFMQTSQYVNGELEKSIRQSLCL